MRRKSYFPKGRAISRKKLYAPLLAAAVAALGLTAGLFSFPGTANAWDIASLPAGFAIQHTADTSATSCSDYYTIKYVSPLWVTLAEGRICTDSPTGFQHDLDAFVDANYIAPVTTTADTTTTTATATDATTTTAAPSGATTPTDTSPVPAETTTVTVTVTDPTVDKRLTALEVDYAALAARVDANALANTAAWDAFIAATAAGESPAAAALAARSAGWNAIYDLGV
jgi:hypothetical protein